uniref:Uncharacterized protein n=1 Tax=Rhizophora mucronata TaxID=61149 RepID=A0A2P2L537_RHIMU
MLPFRQQLTRCGVLFLKQLVVPFISMPSTFCITVDVLVNLVLLCFMHLSLHTPKRQL